MFGHTGMWWHNVAITCMNPPMNWLPVILCPFLVLFWFCFCILCLWVLFCLPLLFAWFMMMTAYWTMHRSFTSSLLWPSIVDGLESQFAITALAMSYSVLNDLADAMKALDGKKKFQWRLRREKRLSLRQITSQKKGSKKILVWCQNCHFAVANSNRHKGLFQRWCFFIVKFSEIKFGRCSKFCARYLNVKERCDFVNAGFQTKLHVLLCYP